MRPRVAASLLVALAVITAVVGAGCTSSGPELGDAPPSTGTAPPAADVPAGPTAPTTPEEGLGEGTAAARDGRAPLRGFSEVAATITAADGETCEVCLLAATTDAQRERGLMEVTDSELGGYDGMLFRWTSEQTGAFWMRNTPMPLSIAYFDDQGRFVSMSDMEPCPDRMGCPTYPASAPFQYAIEVPEGELAEFGIGEGATLTLDALRCPPAKG